MTAEIKLKDAFKTYTHDQDKVLSPTETVRRLKAKLEQLDLDILDRTVRIDSGRLGIPVFFSYCGRDAAALTGTRKQMGKGATAEQAEASAVMELAERFSLFSFAGDPANFITATRRELAQPSLPFEMIAASVHDTSADLEAARAIFENLPLKWTGAYNLTRRETVWVPFDWFYAINAFNGPSAGNGAEEALCQGICEIVERHTSSIVSRQRLNCPGIDPDSAAEPLVRQMIDKYRAAGITVHLTDFTLDMGIPTVGVLAYDPQTFPAKSEIVWTAGTAPAPEKALSRALTEVAQLAGDFNSGTRYVASGLPKFSRLEDADFVTRPAKTVAVSDLPDVSSANIKTEVERCVAELAARDLEVLAIETTHPLLGVPAFYTIVPGAHFRERALNTGVGMFAAKLLVEKLGPAQAERELEGFEKLLPGKYYTSFYRGTCHLALKDPRQALRYFRQALDRQPTRQDAAAVYSYIGIAYRDMEEYRLALEALAQGEKNDAERTDIHNLMGFCHFKLKAHAEAIRSFEKVIALDPSSAIDYANIASNYRDLGQLEDAVRYYLMALEIDPSITFARENLAKLARGLDGTAGGGTRGP
ncbi:MAG: YcaO-like family protein [Desulfobacterales bacterium]